MADRIVMHVDLDSFYASAEELRKPEIRGKPIVTCMYSGRTEDSGAVSAANYPARKLGIHAGMPIRNAKRLAGENDVVFLPSDRDYYSKVSDRIMGMLEGFSDRFQQASIDEAYLEVTERTGGDWKRAEELAKRVKDEVKSMTGLTCSIGVGPNKFVAKMASKHMKPDGLTVVEKGEEEFLSGIPVTKLHGVGPKTTEILEELGIRKAGDIAKADPAALLNALGENKSVLLRDRARGIDDSPVEQQERKQFSRLGTLSEDSRDPGLIMGKLSELSADLQKRLSGAGAAFRTVTLILIDRTLDMQTRSETMENGGDMAPALAKAGELLSAFLSENPKKTLRRVGISVSNLTYKSGKEQKTIADFGG